MKTPVKCLIVAIIGIIATTNCIAQEWTKAQLEVWQTIEDMRALRQAKDIEGWASYIHEQYQGWNNIQPLPISKEMYQQAVLGNIGNVASIDSDLLNPARIVVTGNAAVVDYYYSVQITRTNDEVVINSGKNVEFFIKEGGKWLMLGDMTVIDIVED